MPNLIQKQTSKQAPKFQTKPQRGEGIWAQNITHSHRANNNC